METRSGSSLRLIAPAALIAFGIALMIVIATGGPAHKGSGNQPTKQEQKDLGLKVTGNHKPHQPKPAPPPQQQQSEYVVQTGDTLGGIASKTGVTVEKLQQLNPHLDPQALVSGQRIKLK
jgi:LysM repeat protein